MSVSAKIAASIVRYLENKGIAPDTVLSGAVPGESISEAELRDATGTITWKKFILLLNRAEPSLRTKEDLEEIATYILSDSGVVVNFVARLIRGVTTPAVLYNIFVNLALRRHLPTLEMTVNTSGPQFLVTVRAPDDSPNCETFFRIGLYLLQLLPRLIGLPASVVTAEFSGTIASYLITPPPGAGLLFRFWRSLKAIFFTNSILQNIIELETNVQQTHDALAQAKTRLERSLDDRTEEIRAMNLALQKRLTELARIEELSDTGTFALNLTTRSVRLSSGALRILGIEGTDAEFPVDRFAAAIHPDDRKEFRIALARVSSEAPRFHLEHRILRGDDIRIIQHKGRLIDEGDAQIVIGAVIDLTMIKKNEARLIAEREAALEASKNKSMFLAGMSHEIRTPMTSVLGFAELIINPKTPAEKVGPAK